MLLLALNAIFAGIFLMMARRTLPRGYAFLRDGIIAIQNTISRYPDYRHHVEARRIISEAGWFVIGGLAWLLIGGFAGLAALYFLLQLGQLL